MVDAANRKSIEGFIDSAYNPCKAAWNVINQSRCASSVMECSSSPDNINVYFTEVVNNIVKDIPDCRADTSANVEVANCHLSNWIYLPPSDILNIVKKFKASFMVFP